jgi:hypothetical protein
MEVLSDVCAGCEANPGEYETVPARLADQLGGLIESIYGFRIVAERKVI